MKELTATEIRENTFMMVYGVKSQKDILSLYREDLQQVKRLPKTKQYQGLLELVVKYSYAILYHYNYTSINNNRSDYRKEAVRVLGKLKKVSRKFNGVPRIIEIDDRDDKGTNQVYNAFSFIKIPTEAREHSVETNKKESKKESSLVCTAKDEIRGLKAQLDNETYELSRGQKAEDKEIYIKIAIVALATGARFSDIMENLTISTKKGVIIFDDGLTVQEGVILELDTKTVQNYLKSIRKHYKARIEANKEIGKGVRKNINALKIPKGQNINQLNQLYRECLTSSTPK